MSKWLGGLCSAVCSVQLYRGTGTCSQSHAFAICACPGIAALRLGCTIHKPGVSLRQQGLLLRLGLGQRLGLWGREKELNIYALH